MFTPPLGLDHPRSIASPTIVCWSLAYVVTGGAGTLSFEATRALREHGLASLALSDIDPSQSKQAIEVLQADFPTSKIITTVVNVTNAMDIDIAIVETATELGSVDVLCIFAGMVCYTHAIDMTSNEWRHTIDINTLGNLFCAQPDAKYVSPPSDSHSVITWPSSILLTCSNRAGV